MSLTKRVRVAFAKVAESSLVHFHAIIRLDGATDCATAPGVAIAPEELCDTIRGPPAAPNLQVDAGDGETIHIRPEPGSHVHQPISRWPRDELLLCIVGPRPSHHYVAVAPHRGGKRTVTTLSISITCSIRRMVHIDAHAYGGCVPTRHCRKRPTL
jgi:hypothetical protein